MSKRTPKVQQLNALGRLGDMPLVSFDLGQLDRFITGMGVDWCYYRAIPSTVGSVDRGDYRRPNAIDTISSNGYIYERVGVMTAAIIGNSSVQQFGDTGGLIDASAARLVMPRFFNKADGLANGERIYPAIGDRIYLAGSEKNEATWVVNYQRVDYDFGEDSKPQFPIKKIISVETSTGDTLREGTDFVITDCGNIRWLPGGQNPGINPETNKGLPFGVRYLYQPFYYISQIPHEVRVTATMQEDGTRNTDRMPYHVQVQREYLYINQQNASKLSVQLPNETPSRHPEKPSDPVDGFIPVKVSVQDINNE